MNHVRKSHEQSGSVLIIVLWVTFGLVALALYFANSMSIELRAADNRVSATEAEQAIMGAARYVSNVLANTQTPGALPDLTTYKYDAVPLGDATFWMIGRADQQQHQQQQTTTDVPVFGLSDENSKLNLNTSTAAMLQNLPNMTAELAAAIVDWRDDNENPEENGAESDFYLRKNPPYRCKNANFESVDELRLVNGAELKLLYGEDVNLNGILDLNENDGETTPPSDNRDGRLDRGILDYVTVFSRQPNSTNVYIGSPQLQQLITQTFGASRGRQILRQGTNGPAAPNSVLDFYFRSGMTSEEFQKIENTITATPTNIAYLTNLVNINTASEQVLACIPGLEEKASSIIAKRQSIAGNRTSMAWLKDLIDAQTAQKAGRFLTSRSASASFSTRAKARRRSFIART